ncbi:hypothetical protein A9995_15620 [Erythrobacter sp. QSSC1-22B]|uniref:AMP-binding protein n=1 Tax=Erythrobacter sp. QSSC1-22B TaxID=1860125 RepID=UPI0008053735|nr:AMP-binding protein [Erythrobacter sp. QSSC1-22B]OBX17536.1 hypothetical protein A9995_15620 [Erythrobacter sp. QSSC1-22B]
MASKIDGQRLVAVEKISGVDFVDRADQAWLAKDVLIIGEATGAGLDPHVHLPVRGTRGWWEQEFCPDDSELLAQISSTSGTTGPPKAIAISRRAISDTVRRLREAQEIDSSIREYVAVPTTFSFGLGRIRTVASVGGATYIPGEFRPDELAKMVREKTINSFSAVPSMLRILLANPDLIADTGGAIRWLEIGSQHMSAPEKLRIRQMFPKAAILQHYGLTEASRTTFLRIDQASDEELESVGRPTGAASVQTDNEHRIMIAGSHLASGTVTGGRLHSIVNADGWLQTSDLGEIREGMVYFKGRMDDVANIGGVKVSAEHFEHLLFEILGDEARIAASPLADDIRGQKLGVFYEANHSDQIRPAVLSAANQAGLRRADLKIIELAKIPKTETGKIIRNQLEEFAQSKRTEEIGTIKKHGLTENAPESINFSKIAEIWQDILDVDEVRPEDTFHDLGGDSLSAVGIMLKSEEAGLPSSAIQQMFDGKSLAEIAFAIDNGTNDYKEGRSIAAIRMDALNAVRGLFAILIVISHWSPFFIERMGKVGATLWSFAEPPLRIGTPGFAMVFGMGLGLFYFNQLEQRGDQLRRRLKRNTTLLSFGVAVTALAVAARMYVTGEEFGAHWQEKLFYTVLLFYAFAVPTSLFWLRLVKKAKDPVFSSFMIALLAYAVHTVFVMSSSANAFDGWSSLAWHMLVAPYSYPRLMGAAALGLAAALWLQESQSETQTAANAAKWGVVLSGSGGLILCLLPGGWPANAGQVWAVLPFSGFALLLYAGAVMLIGRGRVGIAMRLAIVCGVLAFPIFIGQGLVMPVAGIVESFGLAAIASAVIPAFLFLAVIGWLGRKVYRVRFTNP